MYPQILLIIQITVLHNFLLVAIRLYLLVITDIIYHSMKHHSMHKNKNISNQCYKMADNNKLRETNIKSCILLFC